MHPAQGTLAEEKLCWLGRCVEWFFDFGQLPFEMTSLEGKLIAYPAPLRKLSYKEIALKIVLILTVLIPVIMLVGKWLYRSMNECLWTVRPAHLFSLFKAASLIEQETLKKKALLQCKAILCQDSFEERLRNHLFLSRGEAKDRDRGKMAVEAVRNKPQIALALLQFIDDPLIKLEASLNCLPKMLPAKRKEAAPFIDLIRDKGCRAVLLAHFSSLICHANKADAVQIARQALFLAGEMEDNAAAFEVFSKLAPSLFPVQRALFEKAVRNASLRAKNQPMPSLRAKALGRLASRIRMVPERALQVLQEAIGEAEREEDIQFREWTFKKLTKALFALDEDRALRMVEEKLTTPLAKAAALASIAAFDAVNKRERALMMLPSIKEHLQAVRPPVLRMKGELTVALKTAFLDAEWALDLIQGIGNLREKRAAFASVLAKMALSSPEKALAKAWEAEGEFRDNVLSLIVNEIASMG